MHNKTKFFNSILILEPTFKHPPGLEEKTDFKRYIRNKKIAIYFWKNVETEAYIRFLGKKFFLNALSSISTNDSIIVRRLISAYLLKNSETAKYLVLGIYRDSNFSDPYVFLDILEFVNQIESKHAIYLIERIKEFILREKPDSILYGPDIIQFIKKLAVTGFNSQAIDLFIFLTKPMEIPIAHHNPENSFLSSFSRNYSLPLNFDQYEELASIEFSNISSSQLLDFIDGVEQNLRIYLRMEFKEINLAIHPSYDPFQTEESIHTEEFGIVLFSKLQELLEFGFDKALEEINIKTRPYFSDDILIFNRLALWLSYRHMNKLQVNFTDCFFNEKYLYDYTLAADLIYVIYTQSSLFKDDVLADLVTRVISIDIDRYDTYDSNTPTNIRIAQRNVKLLLPVQDLLFGTHKEIFLNSVILCEKYKFENKRDAVSTSEIGIEEFRKRLNDAKGKNFWKLIFSYQHSEKDEFEHLAELILQKMYLQPELVLLEEFLSLPDYSHTLTLRFFSRINDTNGSVFYSDGYFTQLLCLIENICVFEVSESSDTNFDITDDLRRITLNYLLDVITNDKIVLDYDLIYRIIKVTESCVNSESSKSIDGMENITPMGVVTQLFNSTPSKALILLIELGFWVARKTTSPIEGIIINKFKDDIFRIMESRLSGDEKDILIHATVGFMLRKLFYIDQNYVRGNIQKIMPIDNLILWDATFKAYLFDPRISTGLFCLLHNHYLIAINSLSDTKIAEKNTFGESKGQALGLQLLNATFLSLDPIENEDNLLIKYVQVADFHSFRYTAHKLNRYLDEPNIDRAIGNKILNKFWTTLSKRNPVDVATKESDDQYKDIRMYLVLSVFKLSDHASLNRYYSFLKNNVSVLNSPFPGSQFYKYLRIKFQEDPVRSIRLLKYFTQTMNFGYYFTSEIKTDIMNFLNMALECRNQKAMRDLEFIVNRLGEVGMYELKDFWNEYFLHSREQSD